MSQDFQKMAEELLPCIGQGWISSNELLCPPELPSCALCTKRATVAAALAQVCAERDKRIAELRDVIKSWKDWHRKVGEALGSKYNERTVTLDEAKKLRSKLAAAENSEQFIAGLEAAKLIVYEMPVHTRCTSQVFKMYDGIQSQIDKAKAELAALKAGKEEP